ncbi:hypothetical protein Leryth_021081 [Lithospermum erythrorhizon]|nr:hypothetical protein Leryth_021081 [Lithospermum erythrorhizon]
MRAGIAPLSGECQCVFLPKSFGSYISSIRGYCKKDQNVVFQVFHSSFLRSRKSVRSRLIDIPVSRPQSIKRSCSAVLDESFDRCSREGSSQGFSSSGYEDDEHSFEMNKLSSVTSEPRRSLSRCRTEFEFLEPMMLDISPEPPEWPEREAVLRTSIEQKAKSFDLPFSLRIIKKKQQMDGDLKGLGYSGCCSVKKAISSMVSVLVELQSHALQMRGVLVDEDLEIIMGKVQREMNSSFLWLFQQVFSRTPELMIHVMTLLADYSVHSVSDGIAIPYSVKLGSRDELTEWKPKSQSTSSASTSILFAQNNPDLVKEFQQISNRELRNTGEMSLWNSILVESAKLQLSTRDFVLDNDMIINFVSPMSVEVEPDDYTEFHRTDLQYQLGLSLEPNNPLLLCNYAQFLHVVVRDYDRAEQCYKRAIQVAPLDAECLCQYANFLWTIRKDFWCAEERYLEALASEPDNPFYLSKYASFLWNTGGEDTCYPLDAPDENKSLNL